MSRVYVYVVDRDFGFAPNPFHGYCTLATCKPTLRRTAQLGDWVIGIGGKRLNATDRCVYAMRVGEKISFNEYWNSPRHRDKRPIRNGSATRMVGDNIYYRDPQAFAWHQADSHHSNTNGTPNVDNLRADTSSDHVLLSQRFYYFGREALPIPKSILTQLRYRNGRGYRVFEQHLCRDLLRWLEADGRHAFNQVLADPFDFDLSDARYSGATNRILLAPASTIFTPKVTILTDQSKQDEV